MSSIASGAIRVFVSSTWLDLQPERQAVETLLQRMRETKFAGMEYFGSRDENTQRASLDEVDRSQVYVGVFAGRYGSGITEDEYRRARDLSLPCFIYFKRESEIPAERGETEAAKIAKLAALKEELRRDHTVTEFSSADDLAAKVTADLHRWLFDQYLSPQLERAAEGALPRDQAQTLLDAIKDTDALDAKLLSRVRQVIISGERNVAVGGDLSNSIIVTGDRNVINVPAAPVFNPLHQLPSPPRDFTGRAEELGELLAALDRGAIISGLQGLGGVGKTALALKLADEIKDRYPDAQFFLDLRGVSDKPLTPAEAMAHVIRAYHPTARLPESEAELQPLYHSVLHDQRALLLMDNARNDVQVRPLTPPASCLLLVTSRQHFTLPGMCSKDLSKLLRLDSCDFLLRIEPRIGDHADEIAALCGDLPLALRVTASALAVKKYLTPADYARRLADERQRLKHLPEVEAALSLSYQMLNGSQQKLWHSLAVFPTTFDLAAIAAVWEMESDAVQDALGELWVFSLVEWDEKICRYWLHDLVRLFANSRMGEGEREAAGRRHAEHFYTVLEQADALYLQSGVGITQGLALYDLERSNIESGQTWCEYRIEEDQKAAEMCIEYPNAGADIFYLRMHPYERIRWLEAALVAALKLKRRVSESNALGNLGLAYANLGEMRKAIEHYEQALAIAREVGDIRGEYKDLGNLGGAHHLLGEERKAIEYYEQALAIAREIHDCVGEGNALTGLGIAYDSLGETQTSIKYYEQALAIFHKIDDKVGKGNALNNLGIAYKNLGEIHKAIEFYEQRLTIAREIGDRRGEGNSLGNLGNAYKNLGEARKAIEFYEQRLTIAREIGDRRGEGTVLGSLGNAYENLGETRKAIEYYKQALVICCEIGDRRGEGTDLFNLSLAVDKLGGRSQAVELAEASLKIREEIEDPRADRVRQQLAEWQQQS